MKLTHPVKKATDIVPEDNIQGTVAVLFNDQTNTIYIESFDVIGAVVKVNTEYGFAVSFQSSVFYRYNHKLKKSTTYSFQDGITIDLVKEIYLCEDIFMAARLIHTAMTCLQQLYEKCNTRIKDENHYPGGVLKILLDGIVDRSDRTGGLNHLYRKDLRRGQPVKLQKQYFDYFSIGDE